MNLPSKRIAEIEQELITQDWTGWASKNYSEAGWLLANADKPLYKIKAILQYLDEQEIATKVILKKQGESYFGET